MPWWLMRVYIEGLENEFSSDGDGEAGAGHANATDDITELGITPHQIV